MLLPLRLGTAPLSFQEDPGLRLGRTPCCTEPVRTSRQPLGGAPRLFSPRIDLDHPRRFPASLYHDPVRSARRPRPCAAPCPRVPNGRRNLTPGRPPRPRPECGARSTAPTARIATPTRPHRLAASPPAPPPTPASGRRYGPQHRSSSGPTSAFPSRPPSAPRRIGEMLRHFRQQRSTQYLSLLRPADLPAEH